MIEEDRRMREALKKKLQDAHQQPTGNAMVTDLTSPPQDNGDEEKDGTSRKEHMIVAAQLSEANKNLASHHVHNNANMHVFLKVSLVLSPLNGLFLKTY